MKKLSILALMTATLFFPICTLAQQQPQCDVSDVHCITFAGATGKFIKFTGTTNGLVTSFVDCFDVDSTLSVPAEMVENGYVTVGDAVKAAFQQCNDMYCNESIALGEDNFVIKSNGQGGYTSTPPSFTVQLNDAYGRSCNAQFKKSHMLRHHAK